MIRNYFKTTLRALMREKVNTIMNVTGLTLGIASSLVLFLVIKHSSSFDRYHTKSDRIYRIVTKSKGNNGDRFTSGTPDVLTETFKQDFPEAEEVVFTSFRSGAMITIEKDGVVKKYESDNNMVFTQPSFFKIFDRKILTGSSEKALDEPNEAIISRKGALRYFGKEDVIGEIVKHNDIDYKISAVMEDYPVNTDFPFDLMLSAVTIKKKMEENGWGSIWSDDQCYFLLKEREPLSKIEARIPAFVKKYMVENPADRTFLMQPLNEVHSDARFGNYSNNTMPKPMLVALSVIAIFLLVTACINFINLNTAEAIKRSKEVGIRKSLGSTRGQLVMQFLGETFLITATSVLLSVAVTQIALLFLNPFMKTSLALNLQSDAIVWLYLAGVTIIVTVFSGIYPAFVVSGFKPAQALKNLATNKNSSGYTLRRGLVIVQFFISQFFVIGSIVVMQQMDFLQKKDLGFDRDAVIVIPIPEAEEPAIAQGSGKMRTLKNEILRLSGVAKASLNNTPPSSGSTTGTTFAIAGKQDDTFDAQVKFVDGNYTDLYNLELIAGENLGDLDTMRGFIVNEKLVKTVGYNNVQDIVGKEMTIFDKTYPVIGVLKDFHTMSLSQEIGPVVLLNDITSYGSLSVKLNGADMQGTIRQIQDKWSAAYPNYIFSYKFLDEQIRGFYESQRKGFILLSIFSSLAIFIGCLGLFGLATFMANQKTKEIGIRKVLGASVESILLLFSREFARLIVVGFVFAGVAAWFVMTKYLEQFAYKIKIGPMIFIAGIGISCLIAALTVGYRSISAATVNPVKSLRSE
ncbi:MAG TPA: ABC transporter permease [Ohtaekwangia sp.]|uniref:ABC transporter permease n=1 Tax=Ohtaekwangia sp. TaxID=2066019 RepID=UPI002F94C68A